MNRASKSAHDFISALAATSERLASHDIVVGSLRCDWGSFGSWVLEAISGAEEEKREKAIDDLDFSAVGALTFRATWDGRDRELYIDTAIPISVLSGPANWKRKLNHSFESQEDALAFAEDYLIEQIG